MSKVLPAVYAVSIKASVPVVSMETNVNKYIPAEYALFISPSDCTRKKIETEIKNCKF